MTNERLAIREDAFDLTKLQAHAVELHLAVDPPYQSQHRHSGTINQDPTAEIARKVQSPPKLFRSLDKDL